MGIKRSATEKFCYAVSGQKQVVAKQPLLDSYLAEGMTPFNAAIRAGLTPHQALKYENLTNAKISFSRISSQRDICERRGITLGAILDKLTECAGLCGHPGAMRTVSAVNTKQQATASSTDFFDVPDWYTRLRALHELSLIAGFIDRKKSEDTEDTGRLTINIIRANTGVSEHRQGNNNALNAKPEAPYELKRAQ